MSARRGDGDGVGEGIGEDGVRRTPKRVVTEGRLLDAALAQLERNGVLAGLNMQEVADDVGMNRGLIHHYFGGRRELLRAAILRTQALSHEQFTPGLRSRTPSERGAWVWDQYSADYARLFMLLAIDGADDIEVLAELESDVAQLEREQDEGVWADDADLEAIVVVYSVFTMGYFVLRSQLAAQLGVGEAQLDRRLLKVLDRLFSALRADTATTPKKGAR